MPSGLVLAVKTDQPEAYVALHSDGVVIFEESWQAHRQLSDTLLQKIEHGLSSTDNTWESIAGIVVYRGPGSFTGLRIGATVANTIAGSNDVPIAGSSGEQWFSEGLETLDQDPDSRMVSLEYGAEANITTPRK